MYKVYWITGVSGVGKTTVAKKLYNELYNKYAGNVILLDGDIIRDVLGGNFGYSADERLKVAMINSRLCKMLVEQNKNVICATISLFHRCHEWNRTYIPGYVEVFMQCPESILLERSSMNICKKTGTLNIEVEEPENPDIVLENYDSCTPDIAVKMILSK